MTSLQDVYAAFLASINTDEWDDWHEEDVEADLYQIYKNAKPWFKLPRVSLEDDGTNFIDDVTNDEIQVIVQYMKLVWFGRVVDSWENLSVLYQERDFSPAKQLSEFRQKHESQLQLANKIQSTYHRSNGQNKPFDYTGFAGGGS